MLNMWDLLERARELRKEAENARQQAIIFRKEGDGVRYKQETERAWELDRLALNYEQNAMGMGE